MSRMMEEALASRVRELPEEKRGGVETIERIPGGVKEAVRAALRAGETHYTSRPGIQELREALGQAIARRGGPRCDPRNQIVVTAGEEEALWIGLLALDLAPGFVEVGAPGLGRHLPLFRMRDLEPRRLGRDAPGSRLVYRSLEVDAFESKALLAHADHRDLPDILDLGDGWAAELDTPLPPASPGRTLLVGNLDALPGAASFRVGFIAGADATLKRAQTWKQAFSICTAGPSQRAALAALRARLSI
jgi:aspartate/methionine/tyrosine aminotransferase